MNLFNVHKILLGSFFTLALFGIVGCGESDDKMVWVDAPFKNYQKETKHPHFKAFAIDVNNQNYGWSWSYPTAEGAIHHALLDCQKWGSSCNLYAVGHEVVFGKNQDEISRFITKYQSTTKASILSPPKTDTPMTSAEIRTALSGQTVLGTSGSGIEVLISWKESGNFSAKILTKNAGVAQRSNGKWWLNNAKLCRKYEKWFSGRTQCGILVRDGSGFYIYDEADELVGTFRYYRP
jgi:hypothetical protein